MLDFMWLELECLPPPLEVYLFLCCSKVSSLASESDSLTEWVPSFLNWESLGYGVGVVYVGVCGSLRCLGFLPLRF